MLFAGIASRSFSVLVLVGIWVCISLSTYRRRLQNNMNTVVKGVVVVVFATAAATAIAVRYRCKPRCCYCCLIKTILLYHNVATLPNLPPTPSLLLRWEPKSTQSALVSKQTTPKMPIRCSPIEIIRHFRAAEKEEKSKNEREESSSIPNVFTYDCYSYYTETILRDLYGERYSSQWRLQSTGQSNKQKQKDPRDEQQHQKKNWQKKYQWQ